MKKINEVKTFDERKEELLVLGKKEGFITFEQLAEALKGLDLYRKWHYCSIWRRK